jgi:hypothetical protein
VETVDAPAASSSVPSDTNGTSNDLVQVDLHCTKSYVGQLYDTPSGHLNSGYFIGDASASTTGMTVAHDIGQQAWTVCVDARGHEHEFKLTAQEYASLSISGMPQKSVMEPAAQAALDSFPSSTTTL